MQTEIRSSRTSNADSRGRERDSFFQAALQACDFRAFTFSFEQLQFPHILAPLQLLKFRRKENTKVHDVVLFLVVRIDI